MKSTTLRLNGLFLNLGTSMIYVFDCSFLTHRIKNSFVAQNVCIFFFTKAPYVENKTNSNSQNPTMIFFHHKVSNLGREISKLK